jgi:Do/DeqQ family serine protease
VRQYHSDLEKLTLDRAPSTNPQVKASRFKQTGTYLSLILLGVGLGLGGAYAINHPQSLARTAGTSNTPPVSGQNENPRVASVPIPSTPTNFVSEVVNQVGPAVVRINASRRVSNEAPDFLNDPFFREFFGSQMPHFPDKQIQRGTGSGFIISSDGKILTNAHVVDGADSVTVTLKDGRTLAGKVLGADPVTDVAVVKIEAKDLPTVKLGNSERIQVGEWAIAIGNPLGLDNTVTVGIISARGRNSSQVGVGDKRVEFIQTDAAINPGNSGGPLLNANGEVIGINTAIIQNAQGIGFAIPISKAQQIAEQLIAKGKVEHAYVGIQMVGITPEIKQELKESKGWNIAEDKGILIVSVMPNSPANRAGLKAGDIIKKVDGQEITNPDEIQQAVDRHSVGDSLPIQIQRDGRSVNLNVTVAVLPTDKQ